jgi:hypothetical protein
MYKIYTWGDLEGQFNEYNQGHLLCPDADINCHFCNKNILYKDGLWIKQRRNISDYKAGFCSITCSEICANIWILNSISRDADVQNT